MEVDKDPERNETRYLHEYADMRGKRILEIGSGDGRLTWRYAEGARFVAGIDVERDELRVAVIERASDLASRVQFVQADSIHLPFSASSFDLAIFAWAF